MIANLFARSMVRAIALTSLAFTFWIGIPSKTASAVDYTHTFCIKLRTGFLDAATGDYGTSNPGAWLGRGVKFNVYGTTRYAGEGQGCATFTATSKALTGITIYSEARLGGTDNIMVRAFPTLSAQTAWQLVQSDAWLPQWVLQVLPSCSGTVCTATVTNTSDSTDVVSNMLAAIVFGVHQIDGATSPRLAGARTLFIHNSGCNEDSDTSCLSVDPADTIEIQPDWNGARRKFLIGHEFGHWLHSNWINDVDILDIYAYGVQNAMVNACDSTAIPGAHGLRSLEFQAGAFAEGVAHYLATLAFNDHNETNAMFQYYKDAGSYEFDLVNVEQGATGGATNWYSNGCDCPSSCEWMDGGLGWVYPEELSTELDWLRAYWDFRTNANPGSKPSHWYIFDHLEDGDQIGYGLTNTHDVMESVLSAVYSARWDETMDANGADNTPE